MRNWGRAQECGKRPLDASPAGWRGPGCGARERWRGLARQHTGTPTDWRPPRGLRGLAGLRDDAPSEARSADGERAGRPRGGLRSVGATSNNKRTNRSRAAGPSGARNTRGATSNNTREQTASGRAAAHRHTQRPDPSRQATRRLEVRRHSTSPAAGNGKPTAPGTP